MLARRLEGREEEIVWACLVAQIHDIHAPVFNLTEEDAVRAAGYCGKREGASDPLSSVERKALAYFAFDTDHFDMTRAEYVAGHAALRAMTDRFGPCCEGDDE